MMKNLIAGAIFLLATQVSAQTRELPDLVTQPTPQAVIDEHLDALNVCDWDRLMAQYPADAEVHLDNGVVIVGREAIGDLFAGFCQAPEDGGLIGITFSTERSFLVGNTLNVQWVANAPFLAEPYRGSDAYVTRDGLMAAMVSTFRGSDLQMK
jgi:hypothetical protein